MSGVGSFLGNINHTLMKWVGQDTKKPKDPTPPPATPAMGQPATNKQLDDAADEEMRKRALGGRSSTMLTGGAGLSSTGTVSSSALLGS